MEERLDFTALDVETANGRQCICSIGLVRVRDGKIVDTFYTLINPEDCFDTIPVSIHGITPEAVTDAPTFAQAAPDIFSFIGEDTIVAHNAPFDLSAIRKACKRYSVALPENEVVDTCAWARSQIGAPDYRLPTVCACFGIEFAHHHNALGDAEACARIAVALYRNEPALPVTIRNTWKEYEEAKRARHDEVMRRIARAQQARDPEWLLASLKKACEDYADDLEIVPAKDGKTLAFKCGTAALFYFVTPAKSEYPYIRISDIDTAREIAPAAKQFADGAWRLIINNVFDTNLFLITAARIVDERNDTLPTFGCCSSFVECSDAGECIKKDDSFYRGCAYRRNLKEGRIFYGKNRNI